MKSGYMTIAGFFGGLAVILGAFGSHLLEGSLGPELFERFEIGVRYHFYHAAPLLALAVGDSRLWSSAFTGAAFWLWTVGTVLFSGSLYINALTDITWLVHVTPIGGLALIGGWVCVTIAGLRMVKARVE